MGKSDRAFVFGLLALLLGLKVPDGQWLWVVQIGICALLVLTILNRARRALAESPRAT
jgi:CDP-diacylglycerol--glycerol-3-phosphate 3-phosphatidyltransferase